MRGGAYNTPSFTVNGTTTAPGLQCDAADARAGDGTRAAAVGRLPLLPDRERCPIETPEVTRGAHET